MAEKHLVCHGALCRCRFGTAPDRLKVASQSDHYINDGGTQKLTANTLDLGVPFLAGTFGACSVTNGGPCMPAITAWMGAYQKVTLSNGGKVLVEDSKAACAIGGPGCVEITFHGQTAELTAAQMAEADPRVMVALNPLVDARAPEEQKTLRIL